MNSSKESCGAKQNPTIMRKNKNLLSVERAGTTALCSSGFHNQPVSPIFWWVGLPQLIGVNTYQ
jgi:hypothetical protein